MPGVDLRVHVGSRGAGDVRAGPGIGPGRRVQAVLDRGLHQRVIGGMERHEVDPVAEAVVGFELRAESIGERAEREVVGRAGELAERGEIVVRPGRAFAPHRLLQRGVLQVQVEVDELARDVLDAVRFADEQGVFQCRLKGAIQPVSVFSDRWRPTAIAQAPSASADYRRGVHGC